MSAEVLEKLRALARAGAARWRALEPRAAARYVYHLQRLWMASTRTAAEAGKDDAPGRRHGEQSDATPYRDDHPDKPPEN